MINYFKYTSGNAFTLSGVDYSGFVNIDDSRPFTGRVKDSFSVELSSKGNFLARSIIEKREFDNSPTASTTNKVVNPEYSPRNVLSNDFLRKNFNILYQNNLSLFSLGQVYNNSYLDTSNFKDKSTLGGFYGLSSTTIDDRDDDNNTLKDLVTPYHIDTFKSASKERFPDLFELDNAKKSYIETFDDGFVYTISTDTKTIAFSGSFTGQIEKIRNKAIQDGLAGIKRLDADKANGVIYSPSLEDSGINYTNIYDRDIYRACTKLKLVDRVKTSNFRVVNNNVSFGKTYKVVQVINNENNVILEISPNTTSEVLATLPVSNLNNPEYVKVEARFTDDLLLIVTKPVSNTKIYNAYFIDLPEFIENGVIPEPKEINRVNFETKYKSPISLDSMFTVYGTASSSYIENVLNGELSSENRYYYPLFENKSAVREFSLSEPREITFPEESSLAGKVFYFPEDYLNGSEERPDGFFIYRGDSSLIDMDVSFSDYDSNLFILKDNGNVTERMVTNPLPITSYVDTEDLLFPPDILFTSPYKFNTNSWKFNTNLFESNRISFINTFTDTFEDKTYSYFHNVGRIYFSSSNTNKKRISLVPADLQSFFNPDIFNTICETSLGINLNVLIQDILRDTINIYNNFTRIPTAGEFKSLKKYSVSSTSAILQPSQQIKLGNVTSRVENGPWEPLTVEGFKQTDISLRAVNKGTETEYLDAGNLYFNPSTGSQQNFITRTIWGPPFTLKLQPVFEFYGKQPTEEGLIIGTPDPFVFPEYYGGNVNPPSLREVIYSGVNDTIQISRQQYDQFRGLSKEAKIEKYYDIVGRKGSERYFIIVEDHLGNTSRRVVSYDEYKEFQNMSEAERMEKYYDVNEIFDCKKANVRWREGVDPDNLPIGANLNQLIEVSEGTILNITPSQLVEDYDGEMQTFTVRVDIPERYAAPSLENLESISCVLQGTNGDRFNRVKVFSDYKIPTPLEIDTRNFYFHSNESVNYLSINRVFSKLFELQKTIYDSILSS